MKNYGMEVIVDLHGCDVSLFTRKNIRRFKKALCREIKMTPYKLVFWDWTDWKSRMMLALGLWKKTSKNAGTSSVQFIMESSIVFHGLDQLGDGYLNVFSCKDFSAEVVVAFARKFFQAKYVGFTELTRGFK